MTNVREAISVSGFPMGADGEDGLFYRVGGSYWRTVGGSAQKAGTVTRITVTDDLPGLHCDLERVRVYDGDTVIFEGPLHNLEGVHYAAPAPTVTEESHVLP